MQFSLQVVASEIAYRILQKNCVHRVWQTFSLYHYRTLYEVPIRCVIICLKTFKSDHSEAMNVKNKGIVIVVIIVIYVLFLFFPFLTFLCSASYKFRNAV